MYLLIKGFLINFETILQIKKNNIQLITKFDICVFVPNTSFFQFNINLLLNFTFLPFLIKKKTIALILNKNVIKQKVYKHLTFCT